MQRDQLVSGYERMAAGALPDFKSGGIEVASGSPANWLSDLLVLTKVRVNFFVVGTTFVGFLLQARSSARWWLLTPTLVGTGLIAGAAAVTNQIFEQKFDRDMVRTRNRPLAAGRISRKAAFVLAAVFLGAGCFCLGCLVNFRAMFLAGMTYVIYAFVYTPLKRLTPACIFVGAVAGALPLLVGWAVGGATLGLWTAMAFGVLFVWQIPHFLAIAWRWRSDYLRAGYRVLPCNDIYGCRTAVWAFGGAMATVAVSFLPVVSYRLTGWYWFGGLTVGAALLVSSARFLMRRNETTARSLFITSLIYLPCVYFLMLVCQMQA